MQLVKVNRMRWFTPTGKQEEFLKAVGSGEYFVGVFSGANAAGKTALLANLLGSFIFGDAGNPFLQTSLAKSFPYPHRARIVSTPKNINEIGAIQTEIKKWWPQGEYRAHKKGKMFDSEYIAGDWVIDIMSYEQDVTAFESATLGVAIFDEPPPLKIFDATIARMRFGGLILIFMTPLDEGGEILEDLEERETIQDDEGNVVGKIKIVYATIEDSCKEHGVRGFLEHKDIVQMVSFYDKDELRARAEGMPAHLVGRIYPDFEDKDPFVVEDFDIPEDWTVVNVIDPHDAIPFAITWAAIDKAGQIWVFKEFPFDDLDKYHSTNLSIPDYARIIREVEGRRVAQVRIIDPFFGNKRYANTGRTVKDELADFGLDYDDGDTSGIELGHKAVREFLKYDKSFPVSPINHPRLHIFKSCRNHWRSMKRYKRKQVRSGEVKDKVFIDETYKHFCDNIRHLVMKKDLWSHPASNVDFSHLLAGGRAGW